MDIQTNRKINDEVWFLEYPPVRIGFGKIKKIYIEASIEQHYTNYKEFYDIEGVYETGISSGVIHSKIPDYHVESSKEGISKIING